MAKKSKKNSSITKQEAEEFVLSHKELKKLKIGYDPIVKDSVSFVASMVMLKKEMETTFTALLVGMLSFVDVSLELVLMAQVLLTESLNQPTCFELVVYLVVSKYEEKYKVAAKPSKNGVYFVSEFLYDTLGVTSELLPKIQKEFKDNGLDFADLGFLPSYTNNFVLAGSIRYSVSLGNLEKDDIESIEHYAAPFLKHRLLQVPEGSLIVIPYDSESLRKVCDTYFEKQKQLKKNRNSLFLYKGRYVLFCNEFYTFYDSQQAFLEFKYAVRTIRSYLNACKSSPPKASLDWLSSHVLSDYEFVQSGTSIEELNKTFDELENVPSSFIAVDTETSGLNPKDGELLTIQIATSPTKAYLIPVSSQYGVSDEALTLIVSRMNTLLTKKTPLYFNMSFDTKWLRHYGVASPCEYHDVQLLGKEFNRNVRPTLTNFTKLYCPELAGYSDVFDSIVDKSRMKEIPLEDMILYACGDVIATYRCFYNLMQQTTAFGANYQLYKIKTRIQWTQSLFLEGVPHVIDMDLASRLVKHANSAINILRRDMIDLIPKPIKARSLLGGFGKGKAQAKGSLMTTTENEYGGHNVSLNLNAESFKKRLFYTKEGFDYQSILPEGVKPDFATKGALHYLKNEPYVAKYLSMGSISKVMTTYFGEPDDEEDDKGIAGKAVNGLIDKVFNMVGTNTGRTNCVPNLQNIPNKTAISKLFRYTLKTPIMENQEGERERYVFIANDYSQIEVRLLALQSKDPELLRVYAEGRDVYVAVAAELRGVSYEDYFNLDKKEFKMWRQKAKAIVLGFMYGMSAKGFITYAETTFGMVFTEEEANEFRAKFFRLFRRLGDYHEVCRKFGAENGYMVCPLGTYHFHENATIKTNKRYHKEREGALRNLINSPIQGLGAFLTMWAASLVMEGVVKHGVTDLYQVNYVHDDNKFMVPESKKELYAGWIQWQMNNLPIEKYFGVNFEIPLTTSCEVGYNYAEMNEVEMEQIVPPWAEV